MNFWRRKKKHFQFSRILLLNARFEICGSHLPPSRITFDSNRPLRFTQSDYQISVCDSLNQYQIVDCFSFSSRMQEIILKRAADLAEALYSMPRNQLPIGPPRSPALNNSSGSLVPMNSFGSQLEHESDQHSGKKSGKP